MMPSAISKTIELPPIQLSESGRVAKENALANSALIGKVTDTDSKVIAVRAQQELKAFIAAVEKARVSYKEPALVYGRAVDTFAATEKLEAEKEFGRISQLVKEFDDAERRRVAEEERLQRAELERIEREKREALAAAKTAEQVAVIEETAAAKAYAAARPIETARVAGQVTRTDWTITVLNPYELAKFHPDCVKIEPLMTPIKTALNEGRTLKGIRAEKIIKADVRVKPERAAIEA